MSIDSSFDTPEHFEQESQSLSVQRAGGGFTTRLLHDQPLVAAAIGIAVGALIGAAFPVSNREKQLASEARARLMNNNPLAAGRQSTRQQPDTADATGTPESDYRDVVGHRPTDDPKASQGPGSSPGLG